MQDSIQNFGDYTNISQIYLNVSKNQKNCYCDYHESICIVMCIISILPTLDLLRVLFQNYELYGLLFSDSKATTKIRKQANNIQQIISSNQNLNNQKSDLQQEQKQNNNNIVDNIKNDIAIQDDIQINLISQTNQQKNQKNLTVNTNFLNINNNSKNKQQKQKLKLQSQASFFDTYSANTSFHDPQKLEQMQNLSKLISYTQQVDFKLYWTFYFSVRFTFLIIIDIIAAFLLLYNVLYSEQRSHGIYLQQYGMVILSTSFTLILHIFDQKIYQNVSKFQRSNLIIQWFSFSLLLYLGFLDQNEKSINHSHTYIQIHKFCSIGIVILFFLINIITNGVEKTEHQKYYEYQLKQQQYNENQILLESRYRSPIDSISQSRLDTNHIINQVNNEINQERGFNSFNSDKNKQNKDEQNQIMPRNSANINFFESLQSQGNEDNYQSEILQNQNNEQIDQNMDDKLINCSQFLQQNLVTNAKIIDYKEKIRLQKHVILFKIQFTYQNKIKIAERSLKEFANLHKEFKNLLFKNKEVQAEIIKNFPQLSFKPFKIKADQKQQNQNKKEAIRNLQLLQYIDKSDVQKRAENLQQYLNMLLQLNNFNENLRNFLNIYEDSLIFEPINSFTANISRSLRMSNKDQPNSPLLNQSQNQNQQNQNQQNQSFYSNNNSNLSASKQRLSQDFQNLSIIERNGFKQQQFESEIIWEDEEKQTVSLNQIFGNKNLNLQKLSLNQIPKQDISDTLKSEFLKSYSQKQSQKINYTQQNSEQNNKDIKNESQQIKSEFQENKIGIHEFEKYNKSLNNILIQPNSERTSKTQQTTRKDKKNEQKSSQKNFQKINTPSEQRLQDFKIKNQKSVLQNYFQLLNQEPGIKEKVKDYFQKNQEMKNLLEYQQNKYKLKQEQRSNLKQKINNLPQNIQKELEEDYDENAIYENFEIENDLNQESQQEQNSTLKQESQYNNDFEIEQKLDSFSEKTLQFTSIFDRQQLFSRDTNSRGNQRKNLFSREQIYSRDVAHRENLFSREVVSREIQSREKFFSRQKNNRKNYKSLQQAGKLEGDQSKSSEENQNTDIKNNENDNSPKSINYQQSDLVFEPKKINKLNINLNNKNKSKKQFLNDYNLINNRDKEYALPTEFIRNINYIHTDLQYLIDYKVDGYEEAERVKQRMNEAIQRYESVVKMHKIKQNEIELKFKKEEYEWFLRNRFPGEEMPSEIKEIEQYLFEKDPTYQFSKRSHNSTNNNIQFENVVNNSKNDSVSHKLSTNIIPQQKQGDQKELERLQIYTNELTQNEKKLIIQENKKANQNLQQTINELIKQYGSMEKMPKDLQKRYFQDLDFVQPVEMQQLYVNRPPKDMYDHEYNIRKELVQLKNEALKLYQHYLKDKEEQGKQFQQEKDYIMKEILEVNKLVVSQFEMDILLQNFAKKANQRNLEFIEKIAFKLKYLKQFSKNTRMQLLQFANLVTYPQGKYIFYQGDKGDNMYIIVRGSVHVRVRQINIEGQEENPVVVSLDDGAAFGELALMQQKQPQGLKAEIIKQQKETNSINIVKLKERVENDIFNREDEKILKKKKVVDEEDNLNDQLEKIQEKKSVRQASIEDNDAMSLIPLTTHLEEITYKLGEVVVYEGDEPDYFYLIQKGKFKIIKQQVIERDMEIMSTQDPNLMGPYRLNFGILDYVSLAKSKLPSKTNVIKYINDIQLKDFEELKAEFSVKRHHQIIIKEDKNKHLATLKYTYFSSDQPLEKIVTLIPILEQNYQYKFNFYISNLNEYSEMGIGIGCRNIIDNNNYSFNGQNTQHGCFLAFSNGQIYSAQNSDLNNTGHINFNFTNNDVIQLFIDLVDNQLIIKNNTKNLQMTIPIDYKNSDQLVPCVVLQNNNDQVKLISAFEKFVPQKTENENLDEDGIYEEDQEDGIIDTVQQFKKLESKKKKKFKFTYYNEFGSLGRGEYFMSRSLISEYLKLDPSYSSELKYDVFSQAKLSIIADSANCQLLRLPKSAIYMIERNLCRQFIIGVSQMPDYDFKYNYEMEKWIQEWDNLKVSLLKDVVSEGNFHKQMRKLNFKNR
ncbi:Phox homologous domain [Pseudocohnilembus persalinus]|uniref:Phox homologous domain n=1 Tax=Pseudocohnilembus persalinus TaxID=266149 RepID=A0A0V0QX33_PSEPJ|nr:Phox homologous domain [Pseudocohnilembus persalinus]|eukprot:KRX06802.1 Phox homologous domain [Pseudocohnilembus persalinus]